MQAARVFVAGLLALAPLSTNLRGQANPPHFDAKVCTDTDANCGLGGVPTLEMLESLRLILDGNGQYLSEGVLQEHTTWFPLDVLAAAYGLDDPGKSLTPARYERRPLSSLVWPWSTDKWQRSVSTLETYFDRAKIQMLEPDPAPSMIFVDVPGIGPRPYDGRLIRALVATELFPYPMHIVFQQRNKVKQVPFVLLNRNAARMTFDCLTQIKHHPDEACSPKTLSSTVPTAHQSFLQGLYINSWVDQSSGQKGRSGDSDNLHLVYLPDVLKNIHGNEDAHITITRHPCRLWAGDHKPIQPPAQADPFPSHDGCDFYFEVTIPPAAGSAYKNLTIEARVLAPKEFFLSCPGPTGLGEKVEKEIVDAPMNCQSVLTWIVKKPVLSSQNRAQPFVVAVERPLRYQDGTAETAAAKTKSARAEGARTGDDNGPTSDDEALRRNHFQIKFTMSGEVWPLLWVFGSRIDSQKKVWCVPDAPCAP